MQTKRRWYSGIPLSWWTFAFTLGIAGLITGSIWDYPIDISLYHPDWFWARFLAAYGPAPCFWWLTAAGLCLGSWSLDQQQRNALFHLLHHSRESHIPQFSEKTGWQKWFLLLICLLAVSGCIWYESTAAVSELKISMMISVLLSLALILFPGIWLFSRIMQMELPFQKKIIKLILLVCAGQFVVVHSLKWLVKRPRFLALLADGSIPFHAWWQNGWQSTHDFQELFDLNYDLFQSFPSGHTASAACSLLGCIFGLHKKKDNSVILFAAAIGFTWLTALSRMVLGFHFLSDVSAGYLITLSLFALGWHRWIHPSSKRQSEQHQNYDL